MEDETHRASQKGVLACVRDPSAFPPLVHRCRHSTQKSRQEDRSSGSGHSKPRMDHADRSKATAKRIPPQEVLQNSDSHGSGRGAESAKRRRFIGRSSGDLLCRQSSGLVRHHRHSLRHFVSGILKSHANELRLLIDEEVSSIVKTNRFRLRCGIRMVDGESTQNNNLLRSGKLRFGRDEGRHAGPIAELS